MSDHSDPMSADEHFEIAVAAHESGDLSAAEREYRRILAQDPRDPVVLHLLGSILVTTGRSAEGLVCLERSVTIDPKSGPAWGHLALARLHERRSVEALEAWIRAWELESGTVSHLAPTFAPHLESIAPKRPEYWQFAGEARLAAGEPQFAETSFRKALEHPPSEDAARTSLGGLLLLTGRIEEAIRVLDTALAPDLMSVGRRINLAQALVLMDQPSRAIDVLSGLKARGTHEVRAMTTARVNAHLRLGDGLSAQEAVKIGLDAIPNDPDLVLLACDVDRHHGQLPLAIERLRSAVVANKPDQRLTVRLASTLADTGHLGDALSILDGLPLTDRSDLSNAHVTRASVLARLGRIQEALEVVRSADHHTIDVALRLELARIAVVHCQDLELGERTLRNILATSPRFVAARRELARLLFGMTLYRDALDVLEADSNTRTNTECQCIAWRCRLQLGAPIRDTDWDTFVPHDRSSASPGSDVLLTMQYPDELDEQAVADCHRRWTRSLRSSGEDTRNTAVATLSKRPIRVGFLSADLRQHPVADFLTGWLGEVDRKRLCCVGLDTTEVRDETTALLKGQFAEWFDVRGHSAPSFRGLVEELGIDILIELGGHTAGSRLDLLQPRVAPLQLSYLGYPNTTGLDSIDFRLVDDITDPEHQAWHGTEHLLRLPSPFLCYRPPPTEPLLETHRDRPPTFGSFNNLHKICDRTVRLWTSAVKSVPDAQLLLKGRHLDDRRVREQLRMRFTRAGLENDRLRFLDPCHGRRSHLARYAEIDVALDSFPYHGTTTTCEALWMGVPVVSRIGHVHRSRVGLCILQTVGLGDLATSSDEQFTLVAGALIRRHRESPESRLSVRHRMEKSRLCDGPDFASRLADSLEEVWSSMRSRSRV